MNNLQFVEHCEKALKEKWGYVWGTYGQILTPKILADKVKQYPNNVGNYEGFIRSNWMNKRACDCVGLIKSFLWHITNGGHYRPETDFNVGMFAQHSNVKGLIKDIPMDRVGLLVWKKGHIGVYVGDGRVIEAHGTKYGVIETPLIGPNSTGWTNWGECHLIDYVGRPEPVSEWAKTAWEKASKKIGTTGVPINDGVGAKNQVTEEQMMVFLDRLGLLD